MPRRATSTLDESALARLLERQDGVVSRGQLVGLGASRADVRRLLARRELVPVHPRVYVDHSGTPTRRQREWAAVLACAPAALHRESALDAHGMTRDRTSGAGDRAIHVLVDRERRVVPPPGVIVERASDRQAWVQDNRRPPRAAFDFAVLKVAGDRTDADSIALLSDAVHQGMTTAARLVDTIDRLPRLRRRALLREILADVAAGTRSVLERRYLRDVERAHGLPQGERQLRQDTASGAVHRDVRYPVERTLVELDGAFGHRDAVDRWADLQRDLDAAVEDHVTLRPGWAQVLEPCRLAGLVAAVLQSRGWAGAPVRCGSACTIVDSGASGPT
ncbi:type IV toxin-antitoxin system AbiEi family antitoxin domain-containing protein [Nocardioides baculatus]|uniref:type IV toxin-antitoxin system AbiEi family antitoxin domain-containing protein n=1 Tax=Nocardioides baculatus TaxID=2801337 RepID=UPI001F263C3B|nr:type IV toxin-antitoxin system AbiEi family antitoxin domain-containing protein [Nocardioides baculatus]